MMRTRRIAGLLLTAMAILMLPQIVAADEGRDGPPGPPPFDRPMPGGMHGMPGPGGPDAGPGPEGRFGPPPAGPWGKGPDLKELFRKFDKNRDGRLTLEEFTEGMKRMHEAMRGPGRPGPEGDRPEGRRPPREGAGPDRPMPPREGPGSHWDGGPRPGPEDLAACPPDGPCPERKGPPQKPPAGVKKPNGDHNPGLEAKVRELEAKLHRLEAKLDAQK
jgi:hypothetical protein